MEAVRETDHTQATKRGANPGLLRPPLVFLVAILLGIALNRVWPIGFLPPIFWLAGPILVSCAILLYLFSYREFLAAGTPVQGSKQTTVIVQTGPYRFSRNPIYLSFILLVLGLSAWLNNPWLLITVIPAVGLITTVVIPREERFLERKFGDQYAAYKATTRRWL